jgi:hypothetical protein
MVGKRERDGVDAAVEEKSRAQTLAGSTAHKRISPSSKKLCPPFSTLLTIPKSQSLIHSQHASQEEGRARCAGEHPGEQDPDFFAHRRQDGFSITVLTHVSSWVPRSARASSSLALPASSPRSTTPSSTSPICLVARPSRVSPVA